MSTVLEQRAEAIRRARGGMSTANYSAIFEGFAARGIPPDDIEPRSNVLTYRAWQAVGRQVRRGEKGVRVVTWIRCKPSSAALDAAARAGKPAPAGGKRCSAAYVFHVSQTDPMSAAGAPVEDEAAAA